MNEERSAQIGIIGFPAGHSISPAFQQAALDARGVAATYGRWETAPEALPARIASLREPGMLGANVTIPHKEAVIPLLDELSPQASAVGAVNTIVNQDGRLIGHNTDGQGFVDAMVAGLAPETLAARYLLLGAGGAARGIAFALAANGAASITIANRTLTRAERLAADVAAHSGGDVQARGEPGDLTPFDIIINTTSLGMAGHAGAGELPCDLASARAGAAVVDIVYIPAETPWLAEARRRGLRALGGLPMLIHQGALAFQLWTGQPAPVDIMERAALAALEARA